MSYLGTFTSIFMGTTCNHFLALLYLIFKKWWNFAEITHFTLKRSCFLQSFLYIETLWCSHIGDHPQEELAKLGDKSERRVESFKNPATFWRPALTYYLNMANSEEKNKIPWNQMIWLFFFPTKILCTSSTAFFWSPSDEIQYKKIKN